jgi:hypothetical protein
MKDGPRLVDAVLLNWSCAADSASISELGF